MAPYADNHLNKGIKAIIFDCDGTLVDSEHAHLLSWRHALQKYGADLKPEEYHHYIGHPAEVNVKILAKRGGLGYEEDILKDKRAYYDELQKEGYPPIQATVDFLHRLVSVRKHTGLKLGLASAATKEEILNNLRGLKIEHLFDVILSGHEDLSDYKDSGGTNKPKPYIYLQAAKLLKLDPAECVVVEDSHAGVTAGVAAGCFTIAVPNYFTRHQDLSHAHLKVESFFPYSVNDFLKMIANQRRSLKLLSK